MGMEFDDGAKRMTRGRGRRLIGAAAALLAGVTAVAGVPAAPAGAVQAAQSVVVSDDPVNYTPHVLNGEVKSVAQIGNTIYLGGMFSRVRNATAPTELTRSNFVAFDANTGQILPMAPTFNGEITTLIAAADGQSLYVGGYFTSHNGASANRVVRISASTGARVTSFAPPTISGAVRDMRLVGNRLIIAGAFTHIGEPQAALGALNAATGARDPWMNVLVAGNHNGGVTQVLKIDVTPDGSRLFAVGNFATLNGVPNRQMFALDLGATVTPANWGTTFYTGTCSGSFQSYMRDLDVAPDGTYLVVTTTGAYAGGPPGPCDTHSRFEVGATGSNVRPTWTNYTGGDTTYAVAVTGEAVYVGGHFRWSNNPWAADRVGAGAVSRQGVAAMDPRNGVALSWNPGRTLGVGVFDLLATPTGLWMASDTDRAGDFEFHGRIAFFPTAGGAPLPEDRQGLLPGRAILLDTNAASGAGTNNAVAGRVFDGTTAQAAQPLPNGGIDWDAVRGAVMIDGKVYAGFNSTNGPFNAYTFDGTTWGPADPVDTADTLVVDGRSSFDTAWHADVRNLTGLFFDAGRLYYTIAGSSNLYYRGFSTESQVVGAWRRCAIGSPVGFGRTDCATAASPGINFADVRSMFIGGGSLYWTDATGNLWRIGWANGNVSGTSTLVSGPAPADGGVDWTARAIFLDTAPVAGLNLAPTAAIAAPDCTDNACDFDGSGSTDADGTIAEHSWDFGDGTPAETGPTVSHAYDEAGTYTVTLTVTDDDGATDDVAVDVTVTDPPANQPPTAAIATPSCDLLACTFDGGGSTDPDGTVDDHSWDFGDASAPGTGATPAHTYGAAGTYTVTLTVTDDGGLTDTETTSVTVSDTPPVSSISFVGAATTVGNRTRHTVTVPAGTQAGDGLLLFAASNTAATATLPTGAGTWQVVGQVNTGSGITYLWQTAAGANAAGATVSTTTSSQSKVNLTVLVYSGTAATPVEVFAAAAETTSTTAHATPMATVAGSGRWVVSFWSHKDSGTDPGLVPPADVTARSSGAQGGSGRILSLAADSGGPVPAGSYGGKVATTATTASIRAAMFTVVLGPA